MRLTAKIKKHFAWLRTLICCVCYNNTSVEVAHVRFSSSIWRKINPGMGTKDHRYAVGLCSECHRRQTAHGDEEDWWLTRAKRDPISLARILWSITGETEMAEAIIRGDKAGEGK